MFMRRFCRYIALWATRHRRGSRAKMTCNTLLTILTCDSCLWELKAMSCCFGDVCVNDSDVHDVSGRCTPRQSPFMRNLHPSYTITCSILANHKWPQYTLGTYIAGAGCHARSPRGQSQAMRDEMACRQHAGLVTMSQLLLGSGDPELWILVWHHLKMISGGA